MKKLTKKINMAIIALMASAAPAMADTNDAICKLLEEFGGVFGTLRTLAFVGAAFTIAGWAWGWISGGKGVEIEDVRKKGTGMLVGFILLFGMGAILTALMAMGGEGGSLGCNVAAAFE